MATVTRERRDDIAKLLTTLATPCGSSYSEHDWRKCPRCLLIEALSQRGGLVFDLLREGAAAIASPPAEELTRCDTCGRPWTKKVSAISGRIVCRVCAAQAPPADPPGLGDWMHRFNDWCVSTEYMRTTTRPMDAGEQMAQRDAHRLLAEAILMLHAARQSDPPGLETRGDVLRLVLATMRTRASVDEALHQIERNGDLWADFTLELANGVAAVIARQSDPPGLVAVVAELQVADRAFRLDEMPSARLRAARRNAAIHAVLAYPLPASQQAKTTGDE